MSERNQDPSQNSSDWKFNVLLNRKIKINYICYSNMSVEDACDLFSREQLAQSLGRYMPLQKQNVDP